MLPIHLKGRGEITEILGLGYNMFACQWISHTNKKPWP